MFVIVFIIFKETMEMNCSCQLGMQIKHTHTGQICSNFECTTLKNALDESHFIDKTQLKSSQHSLSQSD